MFQEYNVLVLCTGNSARSILGEAIINELGEGRVKAYSAGSRPVGRVNPFAIKLLKKKGYETAGLYSKSWDEFTSPGAPDIDLVITVCDNAAGEECPVFMGAPNKLHLGFPDPAAFDGSEEDKMALFEHVYGRMYPVLSYLIESDPLHMCAADLRQQLIQYKEERAY
ncbi:protein-tyrosine-phosphatase [Kordiimonas sediminis]|uniref:Protein-tyrosine-phosphatase n=1 Tax=Kordiimonas sediminis TaxID=1735581 RepID=A0A919AQV4_9PROT|nr:arsenate reductase ArsC [Kordiimonas sediminis]GHF19979.1 protein-tyrosine-phosphatase [Kordiimonas sediminis]